MTTLMSRRARVVTTFAAAAFAGAGLVSQAVSDPASSATAHHVEIVAPGTLTWAVPAGTSANAPGARDAGGSSYLVADAGVASSSAASTPLTAAWTSTS
jgi:hypothetical protein